MSRFSELALAVIFVITTAGSVRAATTISLYDADGAQLPGAQGNLLPTLLFTTQTVSGSPDPNGVVIDSTFGNGALGGYSNFLPVDPVNLPSGINLDLDRVNGFILDFELQVNFEAHADNDRAGFSVIVITNDLKGIEIAFWEEKIWAYDYDDGFFRNTEDEFEDGDIPSTFTNYSLKILGSDYFLSADDALLFSGTLREYLAPAIPYSIENYLFFGDDTTSARSIVTLGDISLTTIPIPPSLGLMLAACLLLVIHGRRQAA